MVIKKKEKRKKSQKGKKRSRRGKVLLPWYEEASVVKLKCYLLFQKGRKSNV